MSLIAATHEVATTNSSSIQTVSSECGSHRHSAIADVDVVAALAHDLRNFMQCVQMSVCVLKSARPDDEQLRDTLETLERDSKTAAPRLNDLIAIARRNL